MVDCGLSTLLVYGMTLNSFDIVFWRVTDSSIDGMAVGASEDFFNRTDGLILLCTFTVFGLVNMTFWIALTGLRAALRFAICY